MFPTIPSDLSTLSEEALQTLLSEGKAAVKKALAAGQTITQKTYADARVCGDGLKAIKAELAAREERKTALAADVDALLSDVGDEDEAPAEEAPAEDEAPADDAGDDEGEVVAALAPVAIPGRFGAATTPAPTAPISAPISLQPSVHLTAQSGVPGKNAGETFADWTELAQGLLDVAAGVDPGSPQRFSVAKVFANYPAERKLTEDINWNLARFERDEMTAALCAPATPYYGLKMTNTDRRPVFNSIPTFEAPRAKVSIYPSPSFQDLAGAGYGIWDEDDDLNPSASKTCQTITCASPTEYEIYGVYRCLTVKNLTMLSYPELVEAYLNRLAAWWARTSEVASLDAMGTAATAISAPALGYNASTSLISTLLNYLALYQEIQRWDIADGTFDIWAPRWLLSALKMDAIRRRRSDGGAFSVPSTATINAAFRDAGFNVTWFIDTPTWGTALPTFATSGVLNLLPRLLKILIAPPGKFGMMDRGNLSVGVAGNNIYRDNASNAKNEFTFFFESFEGVVNTDNLPAHILTMPLCYNGVQIADTAIDCEGNDYAGVGS